MLDVCCVLLKACSQFGSWLQVVVRGQGKNFCAGIDLANISAMLAKGASTACPGRQREALRRHIRQLQNAFTDIEQCRWPVIAAIHGKAASVLHNQTQDAHVAQSIFAQVHASLSQLHAFLVPV